MASAGTVTVDFAAETAGFVADLKKVQTQLGRLETSFKAADKVASLAMRAFSGIALTSFAKQAFEAADATATAAERAGIAVETFSRLQYAAGQTDVEMGALTSGVQNFQIALSKADDESKRAIATLSRFGLQAETLRKLSIEDQLSAVADAFSQIRDPADRTRLAVELFGKSAGPQLVPLLSQGKAGIQQLTAEADRLGITLSTTTAEGLDQADRAIKQLTATLSAYTSKFLAGLSIAILGPPEEIQRLTEQIEDLRKRRDDLQKLGSQTWRNESGRRSALEQAEKLNQEMLTLLDRQRELLNPKAATSGSLLPLPEGIEFSLEAIKSLKIETDGVRQLAEQAAAAYTNLANTVASAPVERMREISEIVGAGYAESQQQLQREVSDSLFAQLEARMQAEQAAAEYRLDLERRTSEAIIETKAATTNAALGLLQALGVKNKAFAVAAIALEKGLAIQRLLMQNQLAAELAFASQLIPGVPTSLATATAAKAAVLAQGRLAAVMVGATGALQIADRVSGSRSAIGTPLNPAYTTTSADSEAAFGAESQRAIQVVITNNVGFDQRVMDQIIAGIREAADDRDVIIFGPGSRQAQEILGG